MKALLKVSLIASAAIAASANAAVVTFSDQATFAGAAGALTTETFASCGNSTTSFSGPVSSSAGPCGGIVSGVTFSPPAGNELYIAGPGQSTNPTTALGVNFPPGGAHSITFDSGISAFGADLFQNTGAGVQDVVDVAFIVSLFGAGDVSLGVFNPLVSPNGGDFFGLISTDLIFRVDISQPDGFAVIDNVSFAAGAGVVPEPGTWAMMLIGFGATGYAMRTRRRRKAAPQVPQIA